MTDLTKRTMLRRINEYDFAIHEMVLFLDTVNEVPTDTGIWSWIDGPWPWENESEEN